ncbi:MAG: cupredoxin domain-containing protein [Actinomycetota bacterium]
MNQQFRDRVVLPFAIPVGALAFIGVLTFGMSRVLLNVSPLIATAVALMTAFNIVVAAFIIAARAKVDLAQLAAMTAVALLPLAIGGAVAAGVVKVTVSEEHKDAAPQAKVVAISAKDLKFDTSTLAIPSAVKFSLKFTNGDEDPHNVEILRAKGGEKLFSEKFFAGPKTVEWGVAPIEAGEYYFQCQVHPSMNGKVTAN